MTHYKLIYVSKTTRLTGAGKLDTTYKVWFSVDKTRILVTIDARGLGNVDVFDLNGETLYPCEADRAEILGLAHKAIDQLLEEEAKA